MFDSSRLTPRIRTVISPSLFSLLFVTSSRALDNPADGFVMCLDQQYQFGSFGGSGCWGWTDSAGREYAFMGIQPGIVCVDVTGRRIVDTIPGPQSNCGTVFWREMKHYSHYLYAVSLCTGTNQGLQIIDLKYLPDSLHLVRTYAPPGSVTALEFCIDTITGYAYIDNSTLNGFRVVSLADPENPVDVNNVALPDIHDLTAFKDTVWVTERLNSTFSIWDLTNKAAPQFITRVTMPDGGLAHNLWPTDDRHYLFSTQETPGKNIKIWDILDYSDIQLAGTFIGPSGLAHNAHWWNGKLFIAHFESGLMAVDVSNPAAPVTLSQFDTYPVAESPNFNGAWGVYPHTQTGRVWGSNLDGKLTILTSEQVDVAADSLVAIDTSAASGFRVVVPVHLTNGASVNEVIIPIDYSGALNLNFDSISVSGLRTNGWTKSKILTGSPGSRRDVWKITGPAISDGTGAVAKIFLRIPAAAQVGDSNPVSLGPVLFTSASESVTGCFTHTLPTRPAMLHVVSCCIGSTGNVDYDPADGFDIADLTVLVDHLFISFQPLSCPAEANIDGSVTQTPDIGDLTALVDHLFISFAPTAICQ